MLHERAERPQFVLAAQELPRNALLPSRTQCRLRTPPVRTRYIENQENTCSKESTAFEGLSGTVTTVSTSTTATIGLNRSGDRWELTLFDWRPDVKDAVKQLPYASYDPETRKWFAPVTAQSLDVLRQLRWDGQVDQDPDILLAPGEQPERVAPSVLRPGTPSRPYVVHFAARDDHLYRKLSAISGSRWSKSAQALTFPPAAALSLTKYVADGLIADPQKILTEHGVTVFFDPQTGEFVVRGDDRAAHWFQEKFPDRDVVGVWQERDLDVSFGDALSEEIYAGELARRGEGIQPEGLQIELFDFQRQDVAFVCARTGSAVFSSMGVGKTAVAIAAGHELLHNRAAVRKNVVIVPPALRTQWKSEIIRFSGCDPDDVVVIDGTKKQRSAQYEAAASAPWVIAHYNAVLLADGKTELPKLCEGAFLVADEVHRLKDHATATTKQMQKLGKRASVRLGLSGTPVENRPGEWFTILSGFVQPGIFGTAMEFLNTYSYPGPHGGFEGARNLPQLRRRSETLYVRHRLEEVATHLPEMRVQTVALEPKPDYLSAIKRLQSEARNEIAADRIERAGAAKAKRNDPAAVLDGYDNDNIEAGAEMTAVGMLKLAYCSPKLLHMSESPAATALVEAGIVPDQDGPKVEAARTLAAEMAASGDRVVMFATSKTLIGLLAERLDRDGIGYVLFTGDTRRSDRDAAVEAFTTPASEDKPGPTVFLATDAGAEGLNLGRCCSTVVNLDIPWTPGRLAQRNARVRRLDSRAGGFLVVNFILAGTIESAFVKLVETKSDLADAILGEDDGRSRTTGRAGRNPFLDAIKSWEN